MSRAVHLELIPNTTTQEFIESLKLLIPRRRRPSTVYSDKAKSFQAEVQWLRQIIKVKNYMSI